MVMKRIDVFYDGSHYSVGGRELADLQSQIGALASTGGWLLVNDGEGARRDSYLWITPGTPISLIPVPDEPVE
jgi:hypothetical protein